MLLTFVFFFNTLNCSFKKLCHLSRQTPRWNRTFFLFAFFILATSRRRSISSRSFASLSAFSCASFSNLFFAVFFLSQEHHQKQTLVWASLGTGYFFFVSYLSLQFPFPFGLFCPRYPYRFLSYIRYTFLFIAISSLLFFDIVVSASTIFRLFNSFWLSSFKPNRVLNIVLASFVTFVRGVNFRYWRQLFGASLNIFFKLVKVLCKADLLLTLILSSVAARVHKRSKFLKRWFLLTLLPKQPGKHFAEVLHRTMPLDT